MIMIRSEMMNYSDREFKSVVAKIGLALIIFTLLFNVLSLLNIFISAVLFEILDYRTAYIITETVGALFYLASFMLPVLFFRIMFSKSERPEPMRLGVKLPKSTVLIIFAAIMLVLSAAYLNSLIVSFFTPEYSASSVESSPLPGYAIVLQIISVAIVPAFCEEFLFRGTILSNLLPYGKIPAILGSALMFGLMHQNAAQFFYATMAGIILGYVYVKTESIWCGTIIHFLNNLFGVIESVSISNFVLEDAIRFNSILEFIIFAIGIISVIVLIKNSTKGKSPYDTGSFGMVLPSCPDYKNKIISSPVLAGFFRSPSVIVFTVIAAINTFLSLTLTA